MSVKNELYYNSLLTDISYNNDIEYRNILLKLFFINNNTISDLNDMDDMDDEIFNSIYKIQDIIFKNTKDILIFQEIYDLAGAKVFSTDRLTGLTILFSYDILPYFHTILCLFLSNPDVELFTTNNIDFIKNNELFIKVKENI